MVANSERRRLACRLVVIGPALNIVDIARFLVRFVKKGQKRRRFDTLLPFFSETTIELPFWNGRSVIVAMARPIEFDHHQALDKALLLFWRKGYQATSLADLVEFMGISRSSSYSAFQDKRSLAT